VATASKDPSFDERLGRLEAIVSELERGELGLETAIERYQEGVELLKGCHGILARFKRRVEELSGEAEAALKPFAGDPDADAPDPPARSADADRPW
jgi:exodeoxyribonuclease VII small subunit